MTKSRFHLRYMVHIYAWFHNKKLDHGAKHFTFGYEGFVAKSRLARPTVFGAS